MKNEQQNTQNNVQPPMPWPDKNAKKKETSNQMTQQQQAMPWPSKSKQEAEPASDNAGNGMSIGTDPETVEKDNETDKISSNNTNPEHDPEINTPVYDPGKTEKKIPVMKTDRPE
jgi:hypothetical protein